MNVRLLLTVEITVKTTINKSVVVIIIVSSQVFSNGGGTYYLEFLFSSMYLESKQTSVKANQFNEKVAASKSYLLPHVDSPPAPYIIMGIK